MAFPNDFLWGVATASYQIEGAAQEDGRGECIWTRFSHTPGKVKRGDTGDVACNHYELYKEDVALMKQIGVDAYRFSLSWPRVLPRGEGEINESGLDFYSRLVDELLAEGITPWATLYHWDLPQALQDKGGWANPDSVKWFTDYANIVTSALGDRIKHWITFNEPWCTAFLGHDIGIHAPGIHNRNMAYKVAHHLLLSHGEVVPIIRANSSGAKAGITLNLAPAEPASDDPRDIHVANRADAYQNTWFLDPVFKGKYPEFGVKEFAPFLDGIDLDAVKVAAVPTDFLGINYYMRFIYAHDPQRPGESRNVFPADAQFTDMGWEIYPDGLRQTLVRVRDEYAPAEIYVTENGAAFPEPDTVNGDVLEDPDRVAFLRGYFGAAEQAIAEGVPLRGYFVWSFLDNFEWAEGYTKRFGIVHVDYQSQKRTLKRSAHFLHDMIKETTPVA
jgi:beta-glucosidase